jgi:hypothetical protein
VTPYLLALSALAANPVVRRRMGMLVTALVVAVLFVASFALWGWMIAGPLWCGILFVFSPRLAMIGLNDGTRTGRHGRWDR